MKILKEIWFWVSLILLTPIIWLILHMDGYYKREDITEW